MLPADLKRKKSRASRPAAPSVKEKKASLGTSPSTPTRHGAGLATGPNADFGRAPSGSQSTGHGRSPHKRTPRKGTRSPRVMSRSKTGLLRAGSSGVSPRIASKKKKEARAMFVKKGEKKKAEPKKKTAYTGLRIADSTKEILKYALERQLGFGMFDVLGGKIKPEFNVYNNRELDHSTVQKLQRSFDLLGLQRSREPLKILVDRSGVNVDALAKTCDGVTEPPDVELTQETIDGGSLVFLSGQHRTHALQSSFRQLTYELGQAKNDEARLVAKLGKTTRSDRQEKLQEERRVLVEKIEECEKSLVGFGRMAAVFYDAEKMKADAEFGAKVLTYLSRNIVLYQFGESAEELLLVWAHRLNDESYDEDMFQNTLEEIRSTQMNTQLKKVLTNKPMRDMLLRLEPFTHFRAHEILKVKWLDSNLMRDIGGVFMTVIEMGFHAMEVAASDPSWGLGNRFSALCRKTELLTASLARASSDEEREEIEGHLASALKDAIPDTVVQPCFTLNVFGDRLDAINDAYERHYSRGSGIGIGEDSEETGKVTKAYALSLFRICNAGSIEWDDDEPVNRARAEFLDVLRLLPVKVYVMMYGSRTVFPPIPFPTKTVMLDLCAQLTEVKNAIMEVSKELLVSLS